MLLRNVLVVVGMLVLSGCRGCTEQHDPTGDWKKFEHESATANQDWPKLEEGGKLPEAGAGQEVAGDPIDVKYQQFCASCHGEKGAGDGAAGAALEPKPRNFATWNEKVTDDYIAKVIREGGAAVGKSATMAAWGGVLSESEVSGLVKKIRSFKK